AYDTLWTHLDHLGFRERADGQSASPRHRLTKDDLKNLLSAAGSILTPPVDIQQIRTSFKSTSAIGRSWRKDIGGVQIPSPVVNKLIDAIKAKNRSILLTGSPGAGKTCVMLALQDELEQQAQNSNDLIPLFIQSREFADLTSAHERQAQGLSENWVEKAARLADDAQVVVIIDSLDVLSIAREHNVLTYFLAQIERLLLIPNITVVTACRDFDLQYDRRIAQSSWETKVACSPLSWDTEIIPLFTNFEIDPSTIDAPTRELIRNPRELALFVELAQQGGSFNVVTSQALAQRYLTTIVLGNLALGDAAMKAIEDMAAEMLQRRSMAVPLQRFTASEIIKRALFSNNVLHEAQDGQLTFGHQTLLDVLVVSGAIRRAETLNSFIQQLPPVPFVRPSIRSFVAQLATGDRSEFRKQLRTVLTGTTAFHIRRLVAETFAEQLPHEDFWPLIRDLYIQHREVFQVIYTQAVRLEWHYFWVQHLVPFLKSASDIDGLTRHMHRIGQWKNDDVVGVIKFWTEMLAYNGVDTIRMADSISLSLADIHEEHLAACAPLVIELLKSPRLEHSFLGRIIVRCVVNGDIEDAVLWNYIAGEICDEDVHKHDFNGKLRCQSHNFGGSHDTFLADRIRGSTELLDLAITSIEHWSKIKDSHYGEASLRFYSEFLSDTSFGDEHSQGTLGHYSGPISIVLDAIESAVLHHARTQSFWWQNNRERLCFNPEGALRYFAVLACIETPTANIDVIARMLSDKALLEHDSSFELGSLIHNAFLILRNEDQNAIQATILTLYDYRPER
ncbi:MAG: ATP-binding protein, partial [Moraxellaceae bacterium]